MELHARTVKLMSDGAKLSDVYAGSLKFLEERKPALKEYLTKNLGFGVRVARRRTRRLRGHRRGCRPGRPFDRVAAHSAPPRGFRRASSFASQRT